MVTPTYRRPEQQAELTRMAQTLLLVRNVRWIVIEDAKTPSKPVARLLEQSGLQYEHLIGGFIVCVCVVRTWGASTTFLWCIAVRRERVK